MNQREFYELAVKPDFPDVMDFAVDRDDPAPDATFSEEAIDSVVNQFKTFLMARTYGTWEKTSKAPKHVRARVFLEFDDKSHERLTDWDTNAPWYSLMDKFALGITQLDEEHIRNALGKLSH